MNEQPTFKAGDEVYCPLIDLTIHTLGEHNDLLFIHPTFASRVYFQSSGQRTNTDTPLNLFHATPENKALLEALYKCEFESPKLKGSYLTRKLLSEGVCGVLCYVSDQDDRCALLNKRTSIICKLDGFNRFRALENCQWKYAVPCNDYANLVDGVLECKP